MDFPGMNRIRIRDEKEERRETERESDRKVRKEGDRE